MNIESALEALHTGQAVVLPTETVYGVAVDALNPEAVAHLIALKGRPPDKPFSLQVPVGYPLDSLATLTPFAAQLIEAYWPGPLTLVLPSHASLHPAVMGDQSIGLRCPDHPLTQDLLQAWGGPLAVPSANRAGEPPAQTAAAALRAFDGAVRVALDGGPCKLGTPSTVLSLVGEPRVLRPGSLDLGALLAKGCL